MQAMNYIRYAVLGAISLALCLSASFSYAAKPTQNEKQPAQPIAITADSLIVEQQSSLARFKGNVEAKQGDVNLRSQEMIVHYRMSGGAAAPAEKSADGKDAVSKIEVIGKVFLSTPQETAQGNQGVYDVDKRLVTLTGNVVLTRGQNVITGDDLVYNMATGVSEIKYVEKPGQKTKKRVQGLFVPGKGGLDLSNPR